jgi:hypothetical protein
MSDIFISYKREEQAIAGKLAVRLKVKAGVSGGTQSYAQVSISTT